MKKGPLFKRAACLQDMTREQIGTEKLALQKALLYYESIHGRPVSHFFPRGNDPEQRKREPGACLALLFTIHSLVNSFIHLADILIYGSLGLIPERIWDQTQKHPCHYTILPIRPSLSRIYCIFFCTITAQTKLSQRCTEPGCVLQIHPGVNNSS